MRKLLMPHGAAFIPPPGLVNPSDSVQARILAANVSEAITVPSGAKYVMLSGTVDFYASFFTDAADNDLVTNGAFATDTGWTKGTGWTIAAGVGNSDASQAGDSDLTQTPTVALIEGMAYQTVFTVANRGAGNVTIVLGDTEGTDRATNATFTETIVAGAGADIDVRADLDWDGDVDNFSVTPAAIVPGADQTEGYASELVSVEAPRLYGCGGIKTISVASAGTPIITAAFYN